MGGCGQKVTCNMKTYLAVAATAKLFVMYVRSYWNQPGNFHSLIITGWDITILASFWVQHYDVVTRLLQ